MASPSPSPSDSLGCNARVTEAEVGAILPSTVTFDLAPFICMANAFVNAFLANEDCYTARTLKEIEKLLSAHFAMAFKDSEAGGGSRIVEERIGEAAKRWANSRTDVGLGLTPYGQMAKVMDCSGVLSSLDTAKRKPIFEVL